MDVKLYPSLKSSKEMESRLFFAIKEEDTNTVHGILSNHLDPNIFDNEGYSPLYYAAIKANMSICHLLVQNGADVNLKDTKMRTPIFGSVFSGSLEITKYLADNHAILDIVDNSGINLLHVAARKGHHFILHFLLSKGVKMMNNPSKQTLLHEASIHASLTCVKYLVEKCQLSTDALDDKKRSALHYACRENHIVVAKYLVSKGASLELVDDDHSTPIQAATQKNHTYLASLLTSGHVSLHDSLESQFDIVARSTHQRNIFLSVFVGLTWFLLSTAWFHFSIQLVQFILCVFFLYRFGYVLQSSTTRNIHYVAWWCGSLWIVPLFAYRIVLEEFFNAFFFLDLVALALCCTGIFFYYKTLMADPGILPYNTQDQDYIYQLVEDGKFFKNVYCSTCLIKKPLRSKHNSETNRCYSKFDHYCIWLNTPIGSKNARDFFFFLITLLPGLMGVFLSSLFFVHNHGGFSWYNCFVQHSQITWTFFIYNSLLILFVASMTRGFVGNTMMNLTSNEVFYPERYPWIFEHEDSIKSAFDKGFKENMIEFLRNDISWGQVFKCQPTSVAISWLQERGMIVPDEITTNSEKKSNF